MNDREKCLREACEIVNGARNQTYGNVEDNFQKIASLWSLYLNTPRNVNRRGNDDGASQDGEGVYGTTPLRQLC